MAATWTFSGDESDIPWRRVARHRYACQRHEGDLASGARRGFFLGDGAGMGKGRQLAGLILENLLAGRRKHVWVTTCIDLKDDAARDLRDVGVDDVDVFALPTDPRAAMTQEAGVLVCTHVGRADVPRTGRGDAAAGTWTFRGRHVAAAAATWISPWETRRGRGRDVDLSVGDKSWRGDGDIRSDFSCLRYSGMSKGCSAAATARGTAGRLEQLVRWCGDGFDGCLLFDESHCAKNLLPEVKGGQTNAGRAVFEIQRRLPRARVVYCSATAVSEPRNYARARRADTTGRGGDVDSPRRRVAATTTWIFRGRRIAATPRRRRG